MRKVAGTITRGGKYYLNIRIPDVLREEYGGREFLRLSLKTSDPHIAARKVLTHQAELQARRDAAESKADLTRLTAALTKSQRQVFDRAGGLIGLQDQHERGHVARQFLLAGTPDVDQFDDPDELALRIAEHRTALAVLEAQQNRDGRILKAFGVDADVSDVQTLDDLLPDYRIKVDAQTASSVESVVSRFTEYHGDIHLNALTAEHLRTFIEACKTLPKIQSGDRRNMSFAKLTALGKKDDVETISYTTRRKYFDMLRGLLAHGVGAGFTTSNPWRDLRLTKPKEKHAVEKVRRPFTGAEIRMILDHVRGSNLEQFSKVTIDFWAPFIAAYHGLRLQEVCQLRGYDFVMREGVWSMQITDEGENMRAKSASSVRWVPVHPALIKEGLRGVVKGRGDACAFQYWKRYDKTYSDLPVDGRGRVSGAYGKRFASLLDRLGLDDPQVVFHSFRHRLQDAADNAGISDAQRRYLTGRANKDAVEGGYGLGASMLVLFEAINKIDPL